MLLCFHAEWHRVHLFTVGESMEPIYWHQFTCLCRYHRQVVGPEILEFQFFSEHFRTLTTRNSELSPHTATPTHVISPYLSSAQQYLTNKQQGTIRKPVIAVFVPNLDCENTGSFWSIQKLVLYDRYHLYFISSPPSSSPLCMTKHLYW